MPGLGVHGAAFFCMLIKVTPQHQHWIGPYISPNVGSQSDPESIMCSLVQYQVMYQARGSIQR